MAADLVLICAGIGADTWDVSPESGPVHLVANVAARLSLLTGSPVEATLVAVQSASADRLLAALSWEEVPA